MRDAREFALTYPNGSTHAGAARSGLNSGGKDQEGRGNDGTAENVDGRRHNELPTVLRFDEAASARLDREPYPLAHVQRHLRGDRHEPRICRGSMPYLSCQRAKRFISRLLGAAAAAAAIVLVPPAPQLRGPVVKRPCRPEVAKRLFLSA